MLRVAAVPALVAMHRERVTETLAGSAGGDAALAAFLKRAIAAGRVGAAASPDGVDVEALLSTGCAA
jgi:hypothetical protein